MNEDLDFIWAMIIFFAGMSVGGFPSFLRRLDRRRYERHERLREQIREEVRRELELDPDDFQEDGGQTAGEAGRKTAHG